MKKIVILLFLIILTACSQKTNMEEIKTAWDEIGLEGKVKSMRTISYDAIELYGSIQKGDISSFFENTLYTFNNEGGLTERIVFEYDLKKDKKETYEYNGNRKIPIKKNSYTFRRYTDIGGGIERVTYIPEGFLDRSYLYKTDEKGNKTEEQIFDGDGNYIGKYVWKLDEKGNVLEKDGFNEQNVLVSRGIVEYDENGNKILEQNYGKENTLGTKYTWKYTKDGKLLEYYMFNIKGSISEGIINEFSSQNNNLSKSITYGMDKKLIGYSTYKWNDKGKLLESEYYSPDGTLEEKTSIKYNDKDQNIEETTQKNGKTFKRITTYDEQGNYIKQVTYENNVAKLITEREIEYY